MNSKQHVQFVHETKEGQYYCIDIELEKDNPYRNMILDMSQDFSHNKIDFHEVLWLLGRFNWEYRKEHNQEFYKYQLQHREITKRFRKDEA